VSAAHAIDAEVRLYNPLLKADLSNVPADEDWTGYLNPDSLERLTGCKVEPSLRGAEIGKRVQFERVGYFCVDPDSIQGRPVFNRTVPLKDAWARIEKRQPAR
jgi:glutaminyl-tRNA synthetase